MTDKTLAKTHGMVFRLWLPAGTDLNARLWKIAHLSSFAENTLWRYFLAGDPATGLDVQRNGIKGPDGKYPKLPEYRPTLMPDGKTAYLSAASMCPELLSHVPCEVSNRVFKLYLKQRWEILTGRRSLPRLKDPCIRFRGLAIRITSTQVVLDDGREVTRYGIVANFEKIKCAMLIELQSRGQSRFTLDWLQRLAESGEHPSSGTISRRGNHWQISLSRALEPGEREAVRDAVPGRELVVYAPADQDVAIRCTVIPQNGRPWAWNVEDADLLAMKLAHAARRKAMGHHRAQTHEGGMLGHGRGRALLGTKAMRQKYGNRVDDWIENRTTEIVNWAVTNKCEGLRLEDLGKRDPKTLRLGSFPYYMLAERLKQKAKTAGLKCAVYTAPVGEQTTVNRSNADEA